MRGKISVKEHDNAVRETVRRLGLDNQRLEAIRKAAIEATLRQYGRNPPLLDLTSARRRLTSLENAEIAGGPLEPFCFALKQALLKYILRLESIRKSKQEKRGG